MKLFLSIFLPACRRIPGSRLRLLVAGLCLIAAPGFRCGKGPSGSNAPAAVPEGPGASLRQQIETLTGGHTRVVWVRDAGKEKDAFALGRELSLMALDTREPAAERVLSAGPGNFSRPLLTPDGGSVIYSERLASGDEKVPHWESSIHAMDWSGSPARRLRAGYAVEVWRDPADGRTWVYAFSTLRDGISSNPEGYRMFRFPLTEPGREEVVWEQGMMSGDNIQLNRRGTSASGLIPWPNAGTFDFPSGRFIRYRNGCWPSLAPDDSGLMWVFDGTHENLRLFLPGVEGNWRVPLGDLAELKGKAAYHPRWSNHPRIMVFTGPHPVKVNQGSGKVSVMLGRFNESLTGIEESVSLRNASGRPDCYPDVWVAGGETVNLNVAGIGPKRIQALTAAGPAPAAAAWEPGAAGLCFLWERSNTDNAITAEKRESSVIPKRHARYGPRFEMLTEGGTFAVDDISAAAVRKALQGGAWSMEMAVTPLTVGSELPQVIFRAGPELEIQQSGYDFIVRTGGRDWQLGAGLAPDRTTHLALGGSGTPGERPVVWMNGQEQDVRPVEVELRASLAPSNTPEVQFGGRGDGSAAWAGRLETVAFHQGPFNAVEAAAHAAWWRDKLTGFTPPLRTVVRARLKEASPRATPDSIGAYRRSWTSALYEKTALLSGPDPGAVFGVAHWTLLDRQPLNGPPAQPGAECELILEPMADHPEMDSEHGSEEILSDDQPFFLDVRPPGE